jgi:hypothetical protein
VEDAAGCVFGDVDAARDEDVAAEDAGGRRNSGCELRVGIEDVGVGAGLLPGAADPAELHAVSASSAQPNPAATLRVPRPTRPR